MRVCAPARPGWRLPRAEGHTQQCCLQPAQRVRCPVLPCPALACRRSAWSCPVAGPWWWVSSCTRRPTCTRWQQRTRSSTRWHGSPGGCSLLTVPLNKRTSRQQQQHPQLRSSSNRSHHRSSSSSWQTARAGRRRRRSRSLSSSWHGSRRSCSSCRTARLPPAQQQPRRPSMATATAPTTLTWRRAAAMAGSSSGTCSCPA